MTEPRIPSVEENGDLFINPIFLVLPVIVLAGVIFLAVRVPGMMNLFSLAPAESLVVEHIRLQPNNIELTVRNDGAETLTIAQVTINDTAWSFLASPEGIVPRLGRAHILLEYEWLEGEAYQIVIFTQQASRFTVDIPAAFATFQPTIANALPVTIIGLLMGLVPIYLAFLWLPILHQLVRDAGRLFLPAVVIGVFILRGLTLLTLGIKTISVVPGPFQRSSLIVFGGLSTFLLLTIMSSQQITSTSRVGQSSSLMYIFALGIGLFGLGEGAITGLAYSQGTLIAGSLPLAGAIIQNLAKGLGILLPILPGQATKPGVGQLALMGGIGGFPVLLGIWISFFIPMLAVSLLLLGIGLGAILALIYEIIRRIKQEANLQSGAMNIFAGVVCGMFLVWLIGLLGG